MLKMRDINKKNINYIKTMLQKTDTSNLFLLGLIFAITIAMSLAKPDIFPTQGNLSSMLLQISDVGLLSLGMMLSFLIGGIDLSIVSNAVLSATVGGMTMLYLEPYGLGVAITAGITIVLLVGSLCGFINGILIAKVGLPAILATIGTNILFHGIAVGITGGSTLQGFPEQFSIIGNGQIFGIYYPFIILLFIILILSIFLKSTSSGARIYLLGSNAKASFFSGIENVKVAVGVHTLIGFIAAISALIIMSRSNSINPDYGSSYLLQTILVCVVGGVNINGGYGKTSGIMLSILLLQLISTSFNMLLREYPGANFFKNFAWGFLLLLIIVLKSNNWEEIFKKRFPKRGQTSDE